MTTRNRVYQLTLTTRSPVHIATGQQLVQDYDFAYSEQERVAYVLNSDAALLLADQEHDRKRQQMRRKIEQFSAKPARQQTEREENALRIEHSQLAELKQRLFSGLTFDQLISAGLLSFKRHMQPRVMVDGAPLVRYVLAGDLSRSDSVNEQIKDAHDRPYLPGSSLKGAIRSALAWRHFPELGLTVSHAALMQQGHNRLPGKEQADANYDEALFVAPGKGTAAHRDLLRMLQVSDSSPIDSAALILAPVTVYGGRPPQASGYTRDMRQVQQGFDVLNVEAIGIGQTVHADVHIEAYPFVSQEQRAKDLNFAERQTWLQQFAVACHERSIAHIAGEIAYFQERGSSELARFYATLQQEATSLGPDSFLLQIGWGAGWESKTLDDRLKADPAGFTEIVHQYKLDQPDKRKSSTYRVGDRFPKTRKLVLNRGTPWYPLGWVRVDLAEVA